MNPDAEYNAQRFCRYCKVQTKVHITLKEWRVLVTCDSCNASYELNRF